MTEAEKDKLAEEALKALESGDLERYDQLKAQYPASPEYVMGMKDIFGAEVVLAAGLNLSEVEEKYGADWYK